MTLISYSTTSNISQYYCAAQTGQWCQVQLLRMYFKKVTALTPPPPIKKAASKKKKICRKCQYPSMNCCCER